MPPLDALTQFQFRLCACITEEGVFCVISCYCHGLLPHAFSHFSDSPFFLFCCILPPSKSKSADPFLLVIQYQGCSRWLFYSQVAFFKTSWRVKLVALKPPKKWLFLNLVAIATKKVASFEIFWLNPSIKIIYFPNCFFNGIFMPNLLKM